ncbi:MAG: BMP family protein [Clostridia bacterium]
MKKVLSIALVLALILSMFVGCAQKTETPAEPATTDAAVTTDTAVAPATPLKVALLLDGNIKDGGWNQLPYEGLMKAVSELGITGDYTELIPQNEILTVMRDYANKGYDLIIANGYTFADALVQVSAEYPKVKFIGTNVPKAGPNLATARIEYGINGHLAGLLMADMTKTKKVGYVCAVESPQMDCEVGNMKEVLQKIDPKIELKGVFTGDWADVNKAKSAATSLADEGFDVIINNIDGATAAVAQMAKEKGIYVIGWSGDEVKLDPDTILSSMLIRNDIVVFSAIKKVIDGEYTPGKSIKFGLDTGALGFGSFGNAVSKDKIDLLLKESDGILKGDIKVNTAVEGWD